MQGRELAEACRGYAEDKKAEEVVILDVRGVSGVTDYFVIVSATREPPVRAVWNEIIDTLKHKHGVAATKPEGSRFNNWVVMHKDIRSEYDLEGLWNDAPVVKARPIG